MQQGQSARYVPGVALSPFWIASAFATQQLPGVPAIMSLGLAMAAIGMVLAHIMYARDVGLSDLWRALPGFAPIVRQLRYVPP